MPTLPAISDELLRRLDVPGPRYTSYPTAPVWQDRFPEAEHVRALGRAASTPGEPLSLYVHLPFCREMCTYCGCNVIVARSGAVADPYLDAVEREAALVRRPLGARGGVSRLHLGGGTPTFLDEAQLERLWRILSSNFDVLPGAELSVEVDPVVTRPAQLELLRGHGWNRLSLGVQDFDPDVQRTVRRIQTVEQTRQTVELARRLGFDSVNLDLIYGLPRQSPASWGRTLDEVLRLAPDRVAVFSFAYVPRVKPHQRLLPAAEVPSGAAKLELYRIAYQRFTDAGYHAIGLDHFALASDELARAEARRTLWRDFQGYTADPARDTVALGVSAISDVGGSYVQNARLLSEYQGALAAGHLPTARGHVRSDEDDRRRAIITSLMCSFEVDLGTSAPRYADALAALAPLERDGVVRIDGAVVRLTPLGRSFVRNAAMAFDAYLGGGEAAGHTGYSRTV